jgi:glycosyltransferase involved in cell wall biosynthesis
MNETHRLKTSVVIVTKDRPENLSHLLKSLIKQSLKPDEVIVVDNNSTKNYEFVFNEFKNCLPLHTFIEKTPAAARRRGKEADETNPFAVDAKPFIMDRKYGEAILSKSLYRCSGRRNFFRTKNRKPSRRILRFRNFNEVGS